MRGEGVKAQLSAEMLILIVVVLAVIALVGSQLLSTANKGGEQLNQGTDTMFWKSGEQVKSAEGEPCKDNENCKLGLTCIEYACKKN